MSQSDPCRGASNLAGRSGSEPVKPRNASPAWNGLRECRECRAVGQSAKAMSASKFWNNIGVGVPGVGEDGMPGRNVQRKLGTTRGSPRRSRTAKASRINRHAVKSRCACEWGGWGRLSDDGPGQNNPDPSEGPWGKAVHYRVHGPTQCGIMMRPRGAPRAKANRTSISVCREQA